MKMTMRTMHVTAAVALGGLAALATATPCDFAELPFQLGGVVEPAFQCQTVSGYSFVQPSTLPTATELTKICGQCGAFLTAVTKAKASLPTCALAMDNGSTVTVEKLLLGVVAQCTGGAAGDSSSDGSTDGSDAGVAPTVINIPTTAPSENPSPTTATPTPSKKTKAPNTTPAPSDDDDDESSSGSAEDSDDEDTNTASHAGSIEADLTPARSTAPEATTKTPRPAATKVAVSSANAAPTATVATVASAIVWALA